MITKKGDKNFLVYYENFFFKGSKEDLIKICQHINNNKSVECIKQLESGEKTELCFGLFDNPFEGTKYETTIKWIEQNLSSVEITRTIYDKLK